MDYLQSVLRRHETIPIQYLPTTSAFLTIVPILRAWANRFLLDDIKISGSNAKGTAVAGVADIDLFVSLHHSVLDHNANTLFSIFNSLSKRLGEAGYKPRKQNVSLRVKHNSTEVDIVPGVKFIGNSNDHWLHVTKSGRDITKTNIDMHIRRVTTSGRVNEIRLTKIWRKQHDLDFSSIYLEEVVISCLSGHKYGNLASNFLRVLEYLASDFKTARVVDPANGSNIISDDLSMQEKRTISTVAQVSISQPTWEAIIR